MNKTNNFGIQFLILVFLITNAASNFRLRCTESHGTVAQTKLKIIHDQPTEGHHPREFPSEFYTPNVAGAGFRIQIGDEFKLPGAGGELFVYVDKILMTRVIANAVVISAPGACIGESAWAGSSIVHEDAKVILITFISPQTFASREILVPHEAEIMIVRVTKKPEVGKRAIEQGVGGASFDRPREQALISTGQIVPKDSKDETLEFIKYVLEKAADNKGEELLFRLRKYWWNERAVQKNRAASH